ncbi:hypothetical protein H6G89_08715 [Oscillatoria sp. FACHB-1407]|uniref:hypothetical protein n=1 Tax=Oscillatoria sp. FACHB-1407 TaxID=2692847 RepID=UPI00168A0F2F|nr:hypothetical protein [Oscillatoria sp. FACHB-1407]MBD2461123.1 hypothetical protein [Oscillatoria sp. FACHB-1407]
MNFKTWQRIWAFLNQPLFVKQPPPKELTLEAKIKHLEKCLAIDFPKRQSR